MSTQKKEIKKRGKKAVEKAEKPEKKVAQTEKPDKNDKSESDEEVLEPDTKSKKPTKSKKAEPEPTETWADSKEKEDDDDATESPELPAVSATVETKKVVTPVSVDTKPASRPFDRKFDRDARGPSDHRNQDRETKSNTQELTKEEPTEDLSELKFKDATIEQHLRQLIRLGNRNLNPSLGYGVLGLLRRLRGEPRPPNRTRRFNSQGRFERDGPVGNFNRPPGRDARGDTRADVRDVRDPRNPPGRSDFDEQYSTQPEEYAPTAGPGFNRFNRGNNNNNNNRPPRRDQKPFERKPFERNFQPKDNTPKQIIKPDETMGADESEPKGKQFLKKKSGDAPTVEASS